MSLNTGEQEADLHVVVDGKTIILVNSVVYLGGTAWEDGGSSKEIQSGEGASRSSSVEESGRHYVGQKTEETTKRKSVGSLRCTSRYIRVGNTGTDREREEEKIQIAENNWVRRICNVTQEDRRKKLREEIGI